MKPLAADIFDSQEATFSISHVDRPNTGRLEVVIVLAESRARGPAWKSDGAVTHAGISVAPLKGSFSTPPPTSNRDQNSVPGYDGLANAPEESKRALRNSLGGMPWIFANCRVK